MPIAPGEHADILRAVGRFLDGEGAREVRLVNQDLRALLPRISQPVLLIWGDADAETPLADGRLMERLIPDAGLVVFEGAGHYAYLEQAGRFAHIVNVFLRDSRGGGE